MSLDPRTIALIEECFGPHKCCRCGFKAQRFYMGKWFCADDMPHYPRGTRPDYSAKTPTSRDPRIGRRMKTLGL